MAKALKKSSKHYKKNPDSKRKKKKYDSEYQKSKKRVKYRVRLNKENKKRGKKGDGKDVSHKRGGGFVLEDQSVNRARNRGKKWAEEKMVFVKLEYKS